MNYRLAFLNRSFRTLALSIVLLGIAVAFNLNAARFGGDARVPSGSLASVHWIDEPI